MFKKLHIADYAVITISLLFLISLSFVCSYHFLDSIIFQRFGFLSGKSLDIQSAIYQYQSIILYKSFIFLFLSIFIYPIILGITLRKKGIVFGSFLAEVLIIASYFLVSVSKLGWVCSGGTCDNEDYLFWYILLGSFNAVIILFELIITNLLFVRSQVKEVENKNLTT